MNRNDKVRTMYVISCLFVFLMTNRIIEELLIISIQQHIASHASQSQMLASSKYNYRMFHN